MASLAELHFPIIVVSNQASIGKRLISYSMLEKITKQFVTELKESGARVDAVYYCPHTPDQNCSCRKPRPGLLEAAAQDWKLDLTRSILIGDSESDLQAARVSNCRAIFVSSQDGDSDVFSASTQWDTEVPMVTDASKLATTVRSLLQLLPIELKAKRCAP
jgi:histidinol-phosphate phosphatase family protein